MKYEQGQRLFEFSTPLARDELVVKTFKGSERVSQPFRFELHLVSTNDDIDSHTLMGKRVTLRIETADGSRHWTGFISAFERLGTDKVEGEEDVYTEYRCEIVPLLTFLARNEESRIFQKKTVREIVEELFQQFQLSDYEFHLSGQYEPIEYCVQYRETTLDFIGRILETAGIFYFFRHDEEHELLILTDNRDNNPPLEQDKIEYQVEGITAADVITQLKRRQSMRSGRVTMRDFNFEKPKSPIEVSVDTLIKTGDNSNYERYLYPGGFTEREAGDELAKLLMEAEEAEYESLDGESNARLLTPGYVFTLEGHPDDKLNDKQLIVSVEHDGKNNLGRQGGAGSYRNRFTVMPHKVQFRPLPKRRRAQVYGPQTAIVVGPPGEEIYTDKYGRVKVKFHWDRAPKGDDKSSCWLRVAQMWAGRQWGTFFVPRIGMEVLVDFLEGDPDQPIVTGCVYNADNMPPYDLPGEATKSTLKTNSSKGGGGFNELRFEDKKGEEQLFFYAQKDMDLRVMNDRRDWTQQDNSSVVNRNRFDETHGNHDAFVKGTRTAEVDGDDNLKIVGKQAMSVGGSLSLKVSGDIGESCTNHSEAASANWYVNAGTNIVIEAGSMITLKAGGASITVSAAGVTIDGPLAKINCGGSPGSGKAASLVAPAKVKPAIAALLAKPGLTPENTPLGDQRGATPPNNAKSHDPDSAANKDKTHFIEIALVDDAGKPVPGAAVSITLPDGSVASGSTDEKGGYKVTNIDPGDCKIAFPELDDKAWEDA
jgi:type VI secretion system secreted protein VgrG